MFGGKAFGQMAESLIWMPGACRANVPSLPRLRVSAPPPLSPSRIAKKGWGCLLVLERGIVREGSAKAHWEGGREGGREGGAEGGGGGAVVEPWMGALICGGPAVRPWASLGTGLVVPRPSSPVSPPVHSTPQ